MNTNLQADSLLLVSGSERRGELQDAMRESLGMPVSVAGSFAEGLAVLARSHFRAIIFDESLADLDPAGSDQFLANCNDEFPVFVTLATTGVPRCLKQIQVALQRFDRERQITESSAKHYVNSQIRDGLTSIFIHAQLALKAPDLPPEAAKHMKAVLDAGEALNQSMAAILDEDARHILSSERGA